MRSDAAPAVQKASASQFGIVEVDGTTITATAGVISAALQAGSGTWTPTVEDQAGNLATVSGASGSYFTVGKIVFFTCAITSITRGAMGAGNLVLVSLPTPISTAILGSLASWNPLANPTAGSPTYYYGAPYGGLTIGGNGVVVLQAYGASGFIANLDGANFSATVASDLASVSGVYVMP
jgi:hypothetical protein